MTEKEKNEPLDALSRCAREDNPDAVKALLKEGANANGMSDDGLPLIWAAYKGHLEIVDILLAAGADRTLRHKDKTPAEWARQAGHAQVVVCLEQPVDQIIFRQKLSDRTLEEIFNFATLERISLIRKSLAGDVEAMTCTGFSAIEDKSRLREAFKEHVRRGGKVDESRVFPNILSKPRIPQLGK